MLLFKKIKIKICVLHYFPEALDGPAEIALNWNLLLIPFIIKEVERAK